MPYISAASTISHQPTFRNAGFSDTINVLETSSEIIHPNYKEYIDAGLLRRMSKILRMSVACAKDSLEQAGLDQPDAIVVGTGLGCLQDTEKFLSTFLTVEGLLPPTSFIQSTHNTIAGQISLSIGNHGYNMTHTQNSLSFEHALQDTMLLLNEGNDHILVGGADEFVGILDEIGENLSLNSSHPMTSGASFFIVSNTRTTNSLARISDVETIGMVQDFSEAVGAFLTRNQLNSGKIDAVLFADPIGMECKGEYIKAYFTGNGFDGEFVDYSSFSGLYATNSAFALNFAVDQMQLNNKTKIILICNYLNKINLGLTLIQSIEA